VTMEFVTCYQWNALPLHFVAIANGSRKKCCGFYSNEIILHTVLFVFSAFPPALPENVFLLRIDSASAKFVCHGKGAAVGIEKSCKYNASREHGCSQVKHNLQAAHRAAKLIVTQ